MLAQVRGSVGTCATGEGLPVRGGRALCLGAAFLLGALPLGGAARAQAPPVQEQTRPGEGLEEAGAAARTGRSVPTLPDVAPGEEVTFQDVLQNPDDIDLNYRYAQTQVADGELRGAATTLERILLVAPELARVRLLYAVVLFRLDNLDESEREFRIVSRLPMPDSLREEVDAYLEQIARRRRVTRMNASLALGMQWDSNRNAGPDGDEVLFLGTPFDLVSGQAAADWSGVGIAGFGIEHDLGYDEGHALLGSAQIYGQKQINQGDLDLMAISAQGGGLWRSEWVDLRPTVFGSYLNLGGESYVNTVGLGVQGYRRLSSDFDVNGIVRADYEWFQPLDRSPITNQRTGFRFEAGLGAGWNATPRLRFDLGLGVIDKFARVGFYAYTGPFAVLSSTYLLGRGQFLISSFSYEHDFYDDPDPLVAPGRTRHDGLARGRLVYGVPLGILSALFEVPRSIGQTIFSVNGEYLNVQSNIRNYQYQNWRVSMLFTRNFDL